MSKTKRVISIVLLAVPFSIAYIVGFFWRGVHAGFATGYSTLQTSMEQELIQEVNDEFELRLAPGTLVEDNYEEDYDES